MRHTTVFFGFSSFRVSEFTLFSIFHLFFGFLFLLFFFFCCRVAVVKSRENTGKGEKGKGKRTAVNAAAYVSALLDLKNSRPLRFRVCCLLLACCDCCDCCDCFWPPPSHRTLVLEAHLPPKCSLLATLRSLRDPATREFSFATH